MNTSQDNHWLCNKSIETGSLECKSTLDDCIPEDNSQISVVIFTPEETINTDKTRCEQLHFNLTYYKRGLFWLPLYKNFNFRATASCSDHFVIKKYNRKGLACIHHTISGEITISGHVTITGFCSYREVKRIIKNEIVNVVKEIGAKKVQELWVN